MWLLIGHVSIFRALALFRNRTHLYFLGISKTQGELVAVYFKLHRVTHGSQFNYCQLSAGKHAHIQKMLSEHTLAAYCFNYCTFANCNILKSHIVCSSKFLGLIIRPVSRGFNENFYKI